MYIIDGHNLIPKIRGLSLEALDDEAQLLALLQEFYRVRRKPVEVFFDGAPPGKAGMRTVGMIRAHFVARDREADEAIEADGHVELLTRPLVGVFERGAQFRAGEL